jgi:HAD superfamily hydrolase (TIGR01493 family)
MKETSALPVASRSLSSLSDEAGRGDNRLVRDHPKQLRAVLFDFAETLFAESARGDWIRAAASRIGWQISETEISALTADLHDAFRRPEIAALQKGRDLTADAHRAALSAGFSAVDGAHVGLADALYDQLLEPDFWQPYPDTEPVLRQLHQEGIRIGVVSNIPWDIRPRFVRYHLAEFVDTFALSCEHGIEKPDPRLFEFALGDLDVGADAAIYVGDNPGSDGGAVAAGLAVILLPPVPRGRPRGLDLVVRVVQ